MDLGAYVQIEELGKVAEANNADVPVLNGIEHEMVVSIDDALKIVDKALDKEPIV